MLVALAVMTIGAAAWEAGRQIAIEQRLSAPPIVNAAENPHWHSKSIVLKVDKPK